MKIVFMGTPEYASIILEHIIAQEDMEVVAVYTQPDRAVGRKRVITAPIVKQLAQQYNIPIYQPERLNRQDSIDELLQIECDFIVVAAYAQLLSEAILNYVPCINLHASILPQYRGASPIQQAILDGNSVTGVTSMLMDRGLDTGAILKISKLQIAPDELAPSLYDRLAHCAKTLTIQTLREFDKLPQIDQDNSQASHCKKITRADGEVEFQDALSLYDRYRAFTPWPGIYLKSGLKLLRISLEQGAGGSAGKIVQIDSDGVVVECSRGVIKIFTVQAPSKKPILATAYVNTKELKVAHTLS